MQNNLKKPLTYEQQLEHLIVDKKLNVENRDNALLILKHNNYYRLSGYMIDFLDKDDIFFKNITFEKIFNIYTIDKEMRSILFALINDIEVYFKTQIVNYFTLKYGPLGHRDPNNFMKYEETINLLKVCNDIKERNRSSLIVKHHFKKYDGCVPLWAMVELMSLGNISKFYSIMKTTDKKAVCKLGFKNLTYKQLESFYHSIVYFRNECCHYKRLYDIDHTIIPKEYRSNEINLEGIDYKRTYSFIVILLLLNPNKKLGEKTIYSLKKLVNKNRNIDFCDKYGFQKEWFSNLFAINGYCISNENPS
ncbi:MAG: Abi family protein [Amedibacillus dolichus]|jgi:hypothetical protein|uniref:Abi family protein n=3 Tax=Amedibacillus dolichus TaxID=31971 RepID=A0A942WC97_9FIRM|nr:Abi family protein [Amedibacillus dolichus]EDP10186.1 Abi-like protein [Amedibacillus dolichus DSM 3991]MBS4884675.1 Abi family protein [Amedibacillus dolichus]MEE0384510.1 Abi family protein [Amedibacillus dolichus]